MRLRDSVGERVTDSPGRNGFPGVDISDAARNGGGGRGATGASPAVTTKLTISL